jgi:hypothetical protein
LAVVVVLAEVQAALAMLVLVALLVVQVVPQ